MIVEVGRGLGSSTQMPAWAVMMETRRQGASRLSAMPLASSLVNMNWEDDFDDLAGLISSSQPSEDKPDQNSTIDQALKDLFGG
jgi:hypothetical protein